MRCHRKRGARGSLASRNCHGSPHDLRMIDAWIGSTLLKSLWVLVSVLLLYIVATAQYYTGIAGRVF
jgi:hypothetical protein